MSVERITYEFEADDDDGHFEARAMLGDVCVARATGMKDGDRVELADICVRDDVRPPYPIFNRRLLWLFGRRRSLQLRKQAIGTTLLRRFIREADLAGVREVWGSVMAGAIEEQPHLLPWYER